MNLWMTDTSLPIKRIHRSMQFDTIDVSFAWRYAKQAAHTCIVYTNRRISIIAIKVNRSSACYQPCTAVGPALQSARHNRMIWCGGTWPRKNPNEFTSLLIRSIDHAALEYSSTTDVIVHGSGWLRTHALTQSPCYWYIHIHSQVVYSQASLHIVKGCSTQCLHSVVQ